MLLCLLGICFLGDGVTFLSVRVVPVRDVSRTKRAAVTSSRAASPYREGALDVPYYNLNKEMNGLYLSTQNIFASGHRHEGHKKVNTYLAHKTTERLTIRPLNMEDATIWEKFVMDPIATKYFPDEMKMHPSVAHNWIEKQMERYQNNQYGLMALVETATNELVGQCGLLTQQVNAKEEIEIGYHLLTQHCGKGYATEAAKKFKEIGFEKENLDTIVSLIHKNNTPSQKVAERNGMSRTTPTLHKGLPSYIYRINKEQYFG